ncbi:MAG TPA: LysR substrate-binding domain-containing protein [Ensifer sp.]|jgi:LysR family nitrogen assimilation transcriptional regulator|uniref:LysR substrate-binding domain-containing protein n=1 Tax=Ensifer sp. TaxID=1872086 RepID=UPI002E161F48|nr:LysR substrate-binding domain-containing protein [Ensifer sp.]
MEQLPGIVRSSSGEVVGAVGLGMSSTLAASLAGRIVDACKARLPNVTLKLSVADSQTIRSRVEAQALDMAPVFEDEMVPTFAGRLPARGDAGEDNAEFYRQFV